MCTGDLILLIIAVCVVLCFALYIIPMSITEDYDYVNVKKYKYFIRLFDFYFRTIPIIIIGGTLGLVLIFIIPLLLATFIGLFFDTTFIAVEDKFSANMICLYCYLVITYNAIRYRYIKL